MSETGCSKRQVTAARQQRQIQETKRLRELVAALPFHKIIQMWETQQREALSKRRRKP